MSVAAILEVHPSRLIAELGVLARCIEECGECAASEECRRCERACSELLQALGG
jgi:hypothetical protein